MLLNPVVPLFPVTAKDTVVIAVNRFVPIVTLDIWELVTFPLMPKSIIPPLSVAANTVVAGGAGDGVSVGVGARVEVEIEVCVGVGVAVAVGVRDGVGGVVGVGVGVGVAGCVGVGEGV